MKQKIEYSRSSRGFLPLFGSRICTLLLTAAIGLCLSACGDKETSVSSPENQEKTTPANASPSPASSPSSSTPIPSLTPTLYHAVIYDNLSKGTRVEMDLFEGQTLDLNSFTQLLGYDFNGCYDKQTHGGKQYIDKTGRVCAELVSDLVLYAWYEPKKYTLSFTCNGESGSQYGIQNENLPYDADFLSVLPLGKIVNDNKLIYSVFYKDLFLADLTSKDKVPLDKIPLNEATFQDPALFTDSSEITLELKTLPISAKAHLDEQDICIRDDLSPFEQRFKNTYICDSLSLKEFDFALLETFGYNTAILKISCTVREKDDGNQEIYVYHTAYENNENDSRKEKRKKEKAMADFLLIEKSHDCKDVDVDETVFLTANVPLSKLKSSDGIYIYYGASGFGEDDWYRISTDIAIEFVKIESQ